MCVCARVRVRVRVRARARARVRVRAYVACVLSLSLSNLKTCVVLPRTYTAEWLGTVLRPGNTMGTAEAPVVAGPGCRRRWQQW